MLLKEKQLKALIKKVVREHIVKGYCSFTINEQLKVTPSAVEQTKKFLDFLNRKNNYMFSAVEFAPDKQKVIVKHPKGGVVEVTPMEQQDKLILRGKDALGSPTQATSVSMFAEPKDIYRELMDLVGTKEKPGIPLDINEEKKKKK